MLIAQLTDLHLGFEANNPDEPNLRRFDAALDWLTGLSTLPEILFITGDLTERGDVTSYRRLHQRIRNLPFPVHLCAGNHDDRAAMRLVFPHLSTADGFIEYAIDRAHIRFIVIDTSDAGMHGGSFCRQRAAWLRAQVEGAKGRSVMIALHHPPIQTGIPWMTAEPQDHWVELLDAAIGDHPDVTMICGHIHRSITSNWRGRMVAVCPSTAPQVSMEMEPIDPERPDNRPMITAEPPGAALHRWTGEGFVTHHAPVGDYPVLARFTEGMQPLVRSLALEHGHKPARTAMMG